MRVLCPTSIGGAIMLRVRRHFLWTVLAAASMAGCGSSTPTAPSGGDTAGPTGAGRATIMLQDSPFSDAKAVLVTFSEVSVHMSGGDFVTLPLASGGSSRTRDPKKPLGAQDVLGTGPLAPGHHTPIPLLVPRVR